MADIIKTEEFVARLTDDCRRRHRHTHFKGRVISFRVQLEIYVKNKWYPVVRYDTTHGFAHRDFIHPDGHSEKTPIFAQHYNDALTFAEADLKDNWEFYRERFLKEVKDD